MARRQLGTGESWTCTTAPLQRELRVALLSRTRGGRPSASRGSHRFCDSWRSPFLLFIELDGTVAAVGTLSPGFAGADLRPRPESDRTRDRLGQLGQHQDCVGSHGVMVSGFEIDDFRHQGPCATGDPRVIRITTIQSWDAVQLEVDRAAKIAPSASSHPQSAAVQRVSGWP